MRDLISDKKKVLSYYFQKKPAQLVYFVTKHCNADCSFCFYKHKKQNKELTIDEIEKISKTMGSLYWLLLSGGEPFLRKDLDKIVLHFRKNTGVNYTQIPTNGYFTDNIVQTAATIASSCPDMKLVIAVSLDSFEEKHDRMRNLPGCYKKANETLSALLKLKSRLPNLNVFINMTLSAYNMENFTEYFNFFSKKFDVDAVKVGYIRGETSKKEALDVSNQYFEQFKDFFYNLTKQKKVGNFFERLYYYKDLQFNETISTILKTHKMPVNCRAGINSLVMYEDGTFSPCEMLNTQLGSIRDFNYNFKKLWNSSSFVKFRKWKKNCVCTYECALVISILYDIKTMMKIFYASLARR